MKTVCIIAGVIIITFILKSCISNTNGSKKQPLNSNIPTKKIPNDKIVFIENVKLEDLKSAIQKFCNIYNQETYSALPLLTILSNNKFVVTFPYDIDFTTYCFFVNYMYYPNDIFYKPTIKAWVTTKKTDDWMTNEIVNKNVMLYIPSDDKGCDNIYLTTSDNIGYKMGFGVGEEKQKLANPIQAYTETIKVEKVEDKESIQFK